MVGFHRTPMRIACGTTSFSISNSLADSSVRSWDRPVMLPPGRAKLATCPVPIGSAWTANTMGIVWVARRAGSTCVELPARMTSTLMRTSSAAISASGRALAPSVFRRRCSALRSSRDRAGHVGRPRWWATAWFRARSREFRPLDFPRLLRARRKRQAIAAPRSTAMNSRRLM